MMNPKIEKQCSSLIDLCLLPRLDDHFNVNKSLYQKNIDTYFEQLITLLKTNNLTSTTPIVSSLFLLYKELSSNGPWTIEDSKKCSLILNQTFKEISNVSLDSLFINDSYSKKQNVFNFCMIKLYHTLTAKNFRKFPAQIYVYIYMIFNCKSFQVDVNPQKVLPVALILSEDCMKEFKIKGLQCCLEILDHCSEDIFKGGNYYEVIYRNLKTNLSESDVETTKTVLECLNKLVNVLPSSVQDAKCHDLLRHILNQLHTESNLLRKALLLNIIKEIIKLLGIESIKHKKKLMTSLTDILETCSSEGVAEILLPNALECLQEWITQCWCLWTFDHKILSTLMKIFLVDQNEKYAEQKEKLILTLVFLCSEKEQDKIAKDLADTSAALLKFSNINNQRLEILKNRLIK